MKLADSRCGEMALKENLGKSKSANRTLSEDTTKSFDEDEHHLLAVKEEAPDLWISSLDQQNPLLLRVNKEDWKRLTDPDGKLLSDQGEPDDSHFPLTVVTVKLEDDDDETFLSSEQQLIQTAGKGEAGFPNSSSVDQIGAETDGEDCGGPESERNRNLVTYLKGNTDENTLESSETDVSCNNDDNDIDNVSGSGNGHVDSAEDWMETRTPLVEKSSPSKTEQHAESQKVLDDYKLFVCDDCGKPFYYLYHLKRHMAHHKGEKPFQCDECGKKFTLRGNLNKHMTIHKGEKPFVCSFCDRRFRLSCLLQSHIVTHLGVKAFTCQHCGERFTREGALKRHVVRHTGVKPFACTICDKRFYRKPDLKCHMAIHSREHKGSSVPRNFACDECGKRFLYKSHVARHMITHSREKTFSCDVCGVMFKWETALKRHEKKFHNQ